MHSAIVEPFSFADNTIPGRIYLDMFPEFCFPQLDKIENQDIMFQ
jgi:hypothetical protein